MRIGLVSDNHGRTEPLLERLFAGCDLLLHAGDIVSPATLADLRRIAPVRAVRGNNDLDPAFDDLPEIAAIELGELTAVLTHQIGARGRLLPEVRHAVERHGARMVVHGHSHRPGAAMEDGLLFVNPGSAGPRRFGLPRAAGLLTTERRTVEVRLHDLGSPRLPLLAPPLVVEL